jgi:hypothetical protein
MRHSKNYFGIWLITLCVVVNLMILLVLAMRMGPNESSYNNGLGNVFALPFLGLGALALIILLCCFPRYFSWRTAMIIVGLYSAMSFVAYHTTSLYGGYRATFKIMDRTGKPISGIRVQFLQQRWLTPGGPLAVFFVQDFVSEDYSDNAGFVHTDANIFTRLFGDVNLTPGDIKPVNPNFKSGYFTITDQFPGSTYEVNWEQPGKGYTDNKMIRSEPIKVPFQQPLPFYLPGKTDDGPYPGN